MSRVNTKGPHPLYSLPHDPSCETPPAAREASLVTRTVVCVAQIRGGQPGLCVSDVHKAPVSRLALSKEAAPATPAKGREAGDQERRSFTSLLSREASLLTPGALARPSLLLLRLATPRLAQKACSSENSEDGRA